MHINIRVDSKSPFWCPHPGSHSLLCPVYKEGACLALYVLNEPPFLCSNEKCPIMNGNKIVITRGEDNEEKEKPQDEYGACC